MFDLIIECRFIPQVSQGSYSCCVVCSQSTSVKNVIAEGYPASQMLTQLFDVIVESEDISDEQKARICKKFGECLSEGADEYLQLLDMASNTMRGVNNLPQECSFRS